MTGTVGQSATADYKKKGSMRKFRVTQRGCEGPFGESQINKNKSYGPGTLEKGAKFTFPRKMDLEKITSLLLFCITISFQPLLSS